MNEGEIKRTRERKRERDSSCCEAREVKKRLNKRWVERHNVRTYDKQTTL